MVRVALAVWLLASLSACASGPLGQGGVVEGRELPRGVAVLVMAVPDSQLEVDEVVENSGAAIVRATRRELTAAGYEAFADGARTLDEAYAAARRLDCELVAEAQILEWTDPGSDWVHGGDRLGVLLSLWSVRDEQLVAWSADELEDQSLHSARESTHRLAGPLLKAIVAEMLIPGATVSRPRQEP